MLRLPLATFFRRECGLVVSALRLGASILSAALMLSFTIPVVPAQTRRPATADSSPVKTVFIVPTSHYDFGFVEPPDAVRERAARHIDEVIRVAEENPDFRWTIESVWQVNEWLKRAKASTSVLPKDQFKIQRLVRLIKNGQVALSCSWGNMHTEFMGTEELNRYIYDYTTLKRNYGINSDFGRDRRCARSTDELAVRACRQRR